MNALIYTGISALSFAPLAVLNGVTKYCSGDALTLSEDGTLPLRLPDDRVGILRKLSDRVVRSVTWAFGLEKPLDAAAKAAIYVKTMEKYDSFEADRRSVFQEAFRFFEHDSKDNFNNSLSGRRILTWLVTTAEFSIAAAIGAAKLAAITVGSPISIGAYAGAMVAIASAMMFGKITLIGDGNAGSYLAIRDRWFPPDPGWRERLASRNIGSAKNVTILGERAASAEGC
ncbi:MAG: hypothetical protein LBI61_02080 [Puniceicoccales bacterium]|nr:hypothetical protein [Puniceicoccales bacterium]